MKKLRVLCVLAAMSVAPGCDRDDSAPPQPSSSSTPAPSTSPTGQPAVGNSVQSAGDDLRQSARDAVVNASTQPAGAQTQAATARMTSDEASTMLEQAMTYVKENKYDLAEKTLKSVEANKASLPKALQDRLAAVRTALTTAKAGGELQIPGLGGLNK